jgi:molecular chaperone DnaJ
MAKRDYYEVLGVDKNVSKQELKKAYRNLAKQYHPDRNKEADAEAKFKEVQEAYDVLSDDQKKQAYDQFGHAGTQGFGGAGGFGGFNGGGFGGFDAGDFGNINDIFEQFFGGGFGGFSGAGRGQSNKGPQRGNDLEMTLTLDFMEAVFGLETEIKYTRQNSCTRCGGSGAKDPSKVKECDECHGSGTVIRTSNTFLGQIQTRATCPTCHGEGKIVREKCPACNGETTRDETEVFKIKVPAGVPDGVTIRYQGKGNAGKKGGTTGDLFLNIEVKPHDIFERRGNDIYMDHEISSVTATLGADVRVPTVHGDVTMKVPSGTQPEHVLKLKGRGGPKFRGDGNGDQYVRLKVKIPTKLSKEQKKIWEQLAKVI